MHCNAQATSSFESLGITNSFDFSESCTDKHLQLHILNSLKYKAQKRFCQAFGLPLPTFQYPTLAVSSDASSILPPAIEAPASNKQGTSRDNCHMLDKEVNFPNSFHNDDDGNITDDIDDIQFDADEPLSSPSHPHSSTLFPNPNTAPYLQPVLIPLLSKPSPNPTPTDSHYSTHRNLILPNLRNIFPEDLTLATLSILNPAFIVAGIFSPLGLPNMNVLGGVWSTAFISSPPLLFSLKSSIISIWSLPPLT
jgi:hypothetical protein